MEITIQCEGVSNLIGKESQQYDIYENKIARNLRVLKTEGDCA